ncbi:coiled-coil and C2 domain-containing protein 1B isoform X1 [Cynoglossus semilaevis]|uniref:Coiled-coil and C2 domain-containing protein 1B n=1 Tax=Cynoglossus semilaevis TaxID=244447 RepID=A0A3P8X2Y1_CYNSE|nr:coiled-coil and C2 domain-containing protein 1B isoform X1 [Cynoglossus semilaevis]XP_024921848.1 coiled-coil and C2 domain-containing protein 1B isoform X1 [Cynoglossus semilaevis]
MFAKKKRAPQPRGQGAAAMQFGLFGDMNPEEMMMGMQDNNLDDPDLEAELAAITGNKAVSRGRARPKGKSPLPMDDIAKMAEACMRDVDDNDDEDLEDDEDLLAELQEVVGEEEEEEEEEAASSPTSAASVPGSEAETPSSQPPQQEVKVSSAPPGSLQHTLEERISMYKTASQNAKRAGESSKARRFDRGLKTLETMLAAVKKGRPVNEAEIPPPVATGAPRAAAPPELAAPARPAPPLPSPSDSAGSDPHEATTPPAAAPVVVPKIVTPTSDEEQSSCATSPHLSRETEESAPPLHSGRTDGTRTMLLERQREYKMAALTAKKQGDLDQAKVFFRIGKSFDPMLEALEKGQSVDLGSLPPPPGQASGGSSASAPPREPPSPQDTQVTQSTAAAAAAAPAASSAPAAPKDALEALEQRQVKYVEAAAQARADGNERKARMHDRIAKQYQSAIRSHKAGKTVNFDELPVPPGFPPIPGHKSTGAEQGFIAALETADKLTSTGATNEAANEDEEEEREEEPAVPQELKKETLDVSAAGDRRKRSPSASPDRSSAKGGLSPTGIQQLEFLEGRKKQYQKAALQAKQKNDLEQAKSLLRAAKGFDPMIEAARQGESVDISSLPSPPGDDDEDFILVHHSDVQISEKAEQVYVQLAKILKEQYEKCMTYSKQFTHLGNISETTKFEKMAESCKKSLEVLRLAQSRGLPPPKHRFEERSFNTVRIFPDLSSTDMVVIIVKAMNLPAPSGIQTNDLDAYVKFDFPYPSSDQPQKHRTNVMKNTSSPEFNQSFTLSINRNHRGFRRVVTVKGLKLELLHKGGFFRSDKPIGTAVVKLDKLETQSEIREIVEVMDGRKHTGGRLEVKVRLREPLNGPDKQTSSERWLVIDQSQVLL